MLRQFKKCLALVDRATVWQAAAATCLVLVTVLLEALGIGLIFAFVTALVDRSRIEQLPWFDWIFGGMVLENTSELLTFLALGLIAVFVVKNLLLLLVYFLLGRFIVMNEASMSARLLDSYLKGAYALHLTRNTAEFIRNVTNAVNTVFGTVIMGYINLASELVLVVALTSVLLLAEPLLTLGALLVLTAAGCAYHAFSRRLFVSWGQQEQDAQGQILQALQQGFHNIKEVKVLGRQDFVLDSFKRPRRNLARIQIKNKTMSIVPRLWVESVVVVGVLLAVVYILSRGGDSAKILGALTLFAAAAFRMIPSMNRILVALNGIKSGTHAVNLVHDDLRAFRSNLDEKGANGGGPIALTRALAMEGLSYHYPEGDDQVLKGIDLVLNKGESLGLVGPSGSGKTTLVDIVLGLLTPTSGRVTVDGNDISDATRSWRRQIGYVPQFIYIVDDTLRRNIAFGLADADIDETKVWKAVRLAQLDELVGALPQGLDTRLGERGIRLSGGQRQRVGIARALYRDPEVLILDEATSALDTETEHEISNAIERLSGEKTLIIIAHRLSTVRKCQRLAFIVDGRLVDIGTFDELAAGNPDFSRLVELSRL